LVFGRQLEVLAVEPTEETYAETPEGRYSIEIKNDPSFGLINAIDLIDSAFS